MKMPLKRGGKKAVQENIEELYHANAHKPAGQKRGRKQIIAIAFAALAANHKLASRVPKSKRLRPARRKKK